MYGQTKIIEDVEKMKAFGKEILKNPKRCRDFLLKTGIYDKDGHLNKSYKSKEK